jgi:hypothetical protein
MAIEIRQLVIRAVVDDGGRSAGANRTSGSSSTANANLPEPRGAAAMSAIAPQIAVELGADERQAIVNACVREVLRKLERARER